MNFSAMSEDFEDIKTIQKYLKELMKTFHEICEENGLVYNLYGGTYLGAVRHGDIIPWDDDIDVSMPRADYEKFIKIVREKYSDKYDISAYPQKNYIYAFAKFGNKNISLTEKFNRKKFSRFFLYIDIFPIDGYPDLDADKVKARFNKLRKLKTKKWNAIARIIPSKTWWKKSHAIIKFFKFLPYRIAGYEKYLKQEVEESLRYKFEECDYVSCAVSWHEKGKTLKKDYLDRVLYDFGDEKYWGMRDYDKYLSNLYGDYMKLPPEEKRKPEHFYKLEFKGVNNMVVGYTSGVYDLFHIGHLNLLKNAKGMCDKLIVGVTVDELVTYKGKHAMIPFEDRIEIIRSIKYVDAAVPQYDMDKLQICKKLKADVLFVGDDWYNTDKWQEYEKQFNEAGIKIIYFPYTKGVSSTEITKALNAFQK